MKKQDQTKETLAPVGANVLPTQDASLPPSEGIDVKGAPTSKEGVAPKDPIKASEKAPTIPKKEQSDNEKKADQLFGVYPGTKEFHFTADGTAFFTPSDARNHAVSLENKEIETIKKIN